MKVVLARYCFCTTQSNYRLKASLESFCVSSARMAAVSKACYLYGRYSGSALMLLRQLFQQLFLLQDSCKLVQMVFLHVPYLRTRIRHIILTISLFKKNYWIPPNLQEHNILISNNDNLLIVNTFTLRRFFCYAKYRQ